MPMTRIPLLLALTFAVATIAPAVRAEEDTAAEVETLFEQLSAEDSKTRDAARKALADLGDEAVPQIKALAERSQDPETRASVEAILDAIEARSVNGPSLITLDVTDMPAEQVIAEIAKQAHTELPVWPEWVFKQGPLKDRKLTLKVKRKPFWNVMRDLLPELGLHLTSHGGGRQMTISQGNDEQMKGPAHIEGPFMVIATSAHESNAVQFANPGQRTSNVSIAMQAFVEPKLKVMGRGHTAVIEELTDESGKSLIVDNRQWQNVHDVSRVQTHFRESTFQFNASVPAGRTKKIGRLKGFVRVLLQTGTERIEVPDIAKAKGSVYTKAGWRLEVKDLSEAGGQYTLRLEVTRDVPIRPQPGQLPQNEWKDRFQGDAIDLLDAEGRRLENGGFSISGQNHIWQCEMRYRRAGTPAGPPATLRWEFPIEAQELRIPFEFKDLPLP